MNVFNVKRAAMAALIGLACPGASSSAWAEIEDYEFQLVQKEIKKGGDAISPSVSSTSAPASRCPMP